MNSKLILFLGVMIIGIMMISYWKGTQESKSDSGLSPTPMNEKSISLPSEVPSVSPTKVINTYVPLKSWTRIKNDIGLNLCLPPKWETGQGSNIYYSRDSAYKPNVTYIQEIPYNNGSRREAYFNFWKADYPKAQTTTKVEEVNVNGNTVLKFNGPEGETIVWYANEKLWQANVSGWSMINSSKTAFLKDFYTMIGCSF